MSGLGNIHMDFCQFVFLIVKTQFQASNTNFFVKGAPEEVLTICRSYLIQGQSEILTKEHLKTFLKASDQMGGQGLRVLAMARGETIENLEFVGLVGLRDPPRPQVFESIRVLQVTNST